MTNIRSFSLTIRAATSSERPWGFFADSELICTILDKLPPSTEDLELATGGMERPAMAGDASHLCSHLAIRLQDFKHVRLGLGMFCAQLFTQSNAPKIPTADAAAPEGKVSKPGILRTPVLDTESMNHPTLCHRRSDSSQATTTKLSDLASAAKGAIQRGQHPKIVSLTIIGSVGGGTDRSRVFVPDALRAKAEGHAWRETTDGFRFSSEYAVSTHARPRSYMYKELGICEGKEEYLRRSRLRPWFWLNEGKAGRWLLSPMVVEGFDVRRGPQYEKFVEQEDEDSEDSDSFDAGNDD